MPTTLDLAGLTTHLVGPSQATTTCVLLHGFGAAGDDLVGLADALDAPVWFVFPEAPLALGGRYGNARAWWPLDLDRIEEDRRTGVQRDRRSEVPDGLARARIAVQQMLAQLDAQFPGHRLVLGGFSQGAMVSLDAALHRAAPPAGLVLMSGTLIAAPVWQPRMATLAGVPVLLSHGQHDAVLPFSVAELLRDELTAAGAAVDWEPFSGGHEIPAQVIDAASALLRAVAER